MKTERTPDKTFEDYLEAMLIIKERKGIIRSIDVAAELNVTKPSVTYTTKRLRERGYITMDSDNFITITDDGIALCGCMMEQEHIAEKIYNRHKTLGNLFIMLGVDEKTAFEDACRVEHDISEDTFNALCRYLEKYG